MTFFQGELTARISQLDWVLFIITDKFVNILKFKSTVTAGAKAVTFKSPTIAPLPYGIGMHVNDVSYLRDSEQSGR